MASVTLDTTYGNHAAAFSPTTILVILPFTILELLMLLFTVLMVIHITILLKV